MSNENDRNGMGAVEMLEGIIERMGFDAYVSEVKRSEDGQEIGLEVIGSDSGRLIGREGQTLDALQLLLGRMVEKSGDKTLRITVDVEGYRQRRDQALVALATKTAQEAIDMNRMMRLEPMSARERRVVHMALNSFKGIVTESEGEGDDRRICIIPQGKA